MQNGANACRGRVLHFIFQEETTLKIQYGFLSQPMQLD